MWTELLDPQWEIPNFQTLYMAYWGRCINGNVCLISIDTLRQFFQFKTPWYRRLPVSEKSFTEIRNFYQMGKSLSYNDRRKNCLFPLFSIFNHCGVVCRISIFIHCISLAIEFAVFKNLLFFIYFLRLKLSLISEAAVIPSSMHYWIDYYSKNIYKSEIQSRDQKKKLNWVVYKDISIRGATI